MAITEILLLSAALSVDALSIGVSCGFSSIRLSFFTRTIICLVSVFITASAVLCGLFLRGIIPDFIGKFAGAFLLTGLGVYMIIGAFKTKRDQQGSEGIFASSARVISDPSECDIDHSKTIDLKEACVIGLALSADSFAAGISVGMDGAEAFFVPLFCGLFQIILLYSGEKIASKIRCCTSLKNNYFSFAAGLILIATAMFRIFI